MMLRMRASACWIFVALQLVASEQVPPFNETLGPQRDRDALLALRYTVPEDGLGRSQLVNWTANGLPCNQPVWPHIFCKEGRVIKLDLSFQGVQGSLPVELREMDALKVLNLEGNRLSGTLPTEWGEPLYFPNLAQLNLATNNLNGTLPNSAWDAPDAWLSLRSLNLARNAFTGGLPDGWLGSARVFAGLRRLDLSNNMLGYASDEGAEQLTEQADWCLPGTPPESTGWCAPQPDNTTAGALEYLDISNNGLQGQLPESWAAMFPRLTTLRVHGNDLSVQTMGERRPAPLPRSWTVFNSPSSFPRLSDFVLYPGNEWICSLPDGDGGYQGINLDGTYLVYDDSGTSYDSSNPWPCPSPPEDTMPTITFFGVSSVVPATASGGEGDGGSASARLEWTQPTVQRQYVFGYRVSLHRWDADTEDWAVAIPWAVRSFRTFLDDTYTSLPAELSLSAEGTYSLDMGNNRERGLHRISLWALNIDSSSSTPAMLEAELIFHQKSGGQQQQQQGEEEQQVVGENDDDGYYWQRR